MMELLKVVMFSGGAVVYLFLIAKLSGKKQISQLDFIDYAIGISIGSIAADMSTDLSDNPFYYYLIAMAIFFLFNLVITHLGRKSTGLKKFLRGKPLLLINNGLLDYGELKKSKIDFYDLVALCRERGYFDLNDIAFAVFETDGEISVLPKSENTPVVVKDVKVKLPVSEIPYYLIVDGDIIADSLTSTGKSREWLLGRLDMTKKEIKTILYAYYDEKEGAIHIHKKNQEQLKR